MNMRVNHEGSKFGRLSVGVMVLPRVGRHVKWNCICDCGTKTIVTSTHLTSGHSTSCGCIRNEATAKRNIESAKHGMWKTPEFAAWSKMLARCNKNTKNAKDIKNYINRGITVCPEWVSSFSDFYAHIGPRPSDEYSLDRIDNNEGYKPGNVRWATLKTQNNNKSTNAFITINGHTKTVAQWAELTGISHRTIKYRFDKQWADSEVLKGAWKHLGILEAAEMMRTILEPFERPVR